MAYAMHFLKLYDGQENCGTPDASLQRLGERQGLTLVNLNRIFKEKILVAHSHDWYVKTRLNVPRIA
jgi:hypothetical protein